MPGRQPAAERRHALARHRPPPGAPARAARAGSNLVRVFDQLRPGEPVPIIQTAQLAGRNDGLAGLDDADFVGSDAGKTGIHALDQVQDLTLLLVPGRATSAVHNAMVAYCEVDRDGGVFAILDPPANQGATDIVTYVQTTAALGELTEFAVIESVTLTYDFFELVQ